MRCGGLYWSDEDIVASPSVPNQAVETAEDQDEESSVTPPPNTPARIAMAELDAEEAAEEECILFDLDQRATAWLNELIDPPPAPRGKHAGGLPPSRLRFQQNNLVNLSQVSSFARVRKNLESEASNTGNLSSSCPDRNGYLGFKNGSPVLTGSQRDPMLLSAMFGRA